VAFDHKECERMEIAGGDHGASFRRSRRGTGLALQAGRHAEPAV